MIGPSEVRLQQGHKQAHDVWQDKVHLRVGLRCPTLLHNMGQGVGFDVFRARSVGQNKVKTTEEQRSPGLSGVEAFSSPEVLKVFEVGPHLKRFLGALKLMSPFLEGKLDGQ